MIGYLDTHNIRGLGLSHFIFSGTTWNLAGNLVVNRKSSSYQTADCGEEMLSGNTWKIAMRVIFYIRLV